MVITINKETLLDLLQESAAEKIDEFSTKHDCHVEVWVVPYQDKFWSVNYECSYNHGIQDDEFELQEAEPYEITVKKWKIKK